MTKIKNLEMAAAISSNSDVNVSNSFFGLREKATYLPTGSRIAVTVQEYSPENGDRLARLLNGTFDKIEEATDHGTKIMQTAIGNVRAEICHSSDEQFLAVQLFRFADFRYHPLTDIKYYKDCQAEKVGYLLQV